MLPFRIAVFVFLALLGPLPALAASAFEERLTALYRPLQADQVALSPDGRHIAYTQNEKGELVICIMAVDSTEKKFRIVVEGDRSVAFSKAKAPPRLRFLQWSSADRLVFAPTEYNNGVRLIAPIYAVTRDGLFPLTLADSDDFAVLGGDATATGTEGADVRPVIYRRTLILGFLGGNRQGLIVEALGQPTLPPADPIPTAIFSISVDTRKSTSLGEEYSDGRFIYDQKARARLLYPHPRLSHTRTFDYNPGTTWGMWRKVSQTWGGPIAEQFRVTVANYYEERAFPLGFDANPNILYYASNLGRDTYGVYALDLTTRQPTGAGLEDPHVDLVQLNPDNAAAGLVFDPADGHFAGVRAVGQTPFTRWLDAELVRVQADVDRKFPQRSVEILQWDDARTRFLLRVAGGVEPGRYYVYQRPENVIVELLRRAPWLRKEDLHAGAPFSFQTPSGAMLTGHLTFPRKSRLNPPPLLIDFSEGLMGRPIADFHPDAQALAEMGFIVARINHRGGDGFGVKHRSAIHAGIDRIPLDDALAAIEWIAQHHPIDRKRIATFGRGLGGYLALRALQLEPAAFRCAVALEAPLNPRLWLEPPLTDFAVSVDQSMEDRGPRALPIRPPPPINFLQEAKRAFLARGNQLRAESSVLRIAEQITKPVMLIVDPGRDSTIVAQNAELRSRLKRRDEVVEYLEVGSGFNENIPSARAKLFREMEEFFNLNLYDYKVKVGPTREIK